MMGELRLKVVVVCALGLVPVLGGGSVPAAAQQPTERERQLEDLVRQLNKRVEQLESRVQELEADRQTEQRVEALEGSVEQIREERPAVSSDDLKRFEKWVSDPATLRPYWKDGLRLDSADGAFKLKIGGRLQVDSAFFCEDGDIERDIGEDFEDNAEFRRARLYISGDIYDNMNFKAQYDFAGGDSDFKDVYAGFERVPIVGNLRIGHYKEPFSLEELTSSNDITFMERSLANTFAPARNIGVMAFDNLLEDRGTWALGFFRQTEDDGVGTPGRAYNATARMTVLPWYEDDGANLLHLGLAYNFQNYEGDTVRFRARPEAHLAPRVVDTGSFAADFSNLVGAEAALVCGPFSLQGEWIQAFVDGARRRVGDPHLGGGYVQASYFLTGEHRPYKTSSGTFDRVKPKRNFNVTGEGRGAWELALRYSYLDLNDEGVEGGRLRDMTLGLNWYLNPNTRVMWNYVLADPTDGGDVSIFQWRFQLAF